MRKTKIMYNRNSQAFTAIIEDRGRVIGSGYGTTREHALKQAKLDSKGKIVDDKNIKISVCI